MKKILGVSIIAALAVTPMMANAAAVAGAPTSFGANPDSDAVAAATATGAPKYQLVEANGETDGNAASAGYVKGAYNAAIKAINKVHDEVSSITGDALTTAGDGLAKNGHTVSVNLTENGGLQVDDTNKTLEVVVDTTTIEKNSSTGALQVKANTFDAYGDASTAKSEVETKLTAGASGYDIDANSLEVQNVPVVTTSGTQTLTNKTIDTATNTISNLGTGNFNSNNLATGTANNTTLPTKGYVDDAISGLATDYATKTGVNNTIKATTIDVTVPDFTLTSGTVSGTATVPIMDNWSTPNTPASTELAVNYSLSVGTAITEGNVTAAVNANSVNYATANTTGD